jgi:hypothetical protein
MDGTSEFQPPRPRIEQHNPIFIGPTSTYKHKPARAQQKETAKPKSKWNTH